jgi:hypothetical protein
MQGHLPYILSAQMNPFQLLRRNIREFYEQYPLAGCGTLAAAMFAFFILLLILPPEVVEVLRLLLSILSLCSALFGSE